VTATRATIVADESDSFTDITTDVDIHPCREVLVSDLTARRLRPPGRYGDAPRPAVRKAWLVLAGVVVTALLGGLLWTAYHWSTPDVRWGLVRFDVSGERSVSAQFWVRRDPAKAVTCTVQARAADHGIVGVREVVVPAGEPRQRGVSVTLRTSDRPVNAEVARCRVVP
jgi:hypothetical protein